MPALTSILPPRTREIYTSIYYGHVFFFFCNHTGYTEYSHESSTAPTMASFGICSPGSIIGQTKRRSRSAASLRPLRGVMPSKIRSRWVFMHSRLFVSGQSIPSPLYPLLQRRLPTRFHGPEFQRPRGSRPGPSGKGSPAPELVCPYPPRK